MKIITPCAELIEITPDSAQLIEEAGRCCYKSESSITRDSANKFIDMIMKRGHHSVIEHAYATFRIVTDRGITHEIVRHRLASYSQESTRYCNYGKEKFGKEISVIEPSGFTEEQRGWWFAAMLKAERYYFDLLEAGCKPQTARSVLPTCLKTEIVMTCNFREWLHFLTLRLAPAAHPDMRHIAYQIWFFLNEKCPSIFGRVKHLADEYNEYLEKLKGTTP
jgi:thymidylate synthase (FAD)